MTDFAVARFDRSPDGPKDIFLRKQAYATEEGFGVEASTYPVTITMARYGGTYEGGKWLAFPVTPALLAKKEWQGWNDSDVECSQWWDKAYHEDWPIGKGATPELAYRNLIALAAARGDVDLADWSQEPTWDKSELRRRHDAAL